MTEKYFSRKECEGCGTTIDVNVEQGLLGRLKKVPYPQGWEIREGLMFCPECMAKYLQMFSDLVTKLRKQNVKTESQYKPKP